MYEAVTESEAYQDPEAIVVGTKWVLTEKGKPEAPTIKARLVAQEFAGKGDRSEVFAGTPCLRQIKMVLSNLATANEDPTRRRLAIIVDVKTAFLYASVNRKIFVRLPPEAARGARTHGRLKRAMYGTRDAPRLW